MCVSLAGGKDINLYVIDYNNNKERNTNMEKKEDLNLCNSSASMTRGVVGDGWVNIDMSVKYLKSLRCVYRG